VPAPKMKFVERPMSRGLDRKEEDCLIKRGKFIPSLEENQGSSWVRLTLYVPEIRSEGERSEGN